MLRKLAQHILIAATAFILSAITVMTPTWAATPHPSASTATQLPDGRFLIAGGETNQKPSNRLSIYDTKTDQTTPLNTRLSTARKNHSATLLPDGRVFIYGGTGSDNITLGTAELYDPASGKLSTVAAPGLVARSHHSATLLTNGKILIVGGLCSAPHLNHNLSRIPHHTISQNPSGFPTFTS